MTYPAAVRDMTSHASAPASLLTWAIAYLRFGFSIVPVHRATKLPCVRWKPYQRRRATEAEVRDWWHRWPDANLAIVTGAVSGVVVLDVDGDTGRENLRAKGALLPDTTPRVRTRKGHHFYFAHPGYELRPWANPEDVERIPPEWRGLDFRGDGGYVIAPPSLHASGHVYSWEVLPHGFALP